MAVAAPHATGSTPAAEHPGKPVAPPSRVLLVALMACLAYAAFAGGATGLPEESRVQIGLLVLAGGALAAGLYGRDLAAAASPVAWAGIALLVAFAAWSGASLAWSVTPDRSWNELNRGVAYALAAGLGVTLGSSLSRAPARACAGLATVGGLVALYALAGKTVPGIAIGGLIDLDHAGEITRLRAPFGYWNALGLLCASCAMPALAVALDARRRPRGRLLGLGALAVMLAALALTYSRGGLIALAVALVVALLAGRSPARVLLAVAGAALAVAPALAVALSRDDLTTDGVALAQRTDDAAVVGVLLLAGLGVLALGWRGLVALERRGAFSPARARLALRGAIGAVAAVAAFAVIGAAASERGLGGVIGDAGERFTQVRGDPATDPARVLSANSGNRWEWWKEAAGAWSDRPVAGWGAGSFPVTHRLYRTTPLDVRQPHSMPMQWLAETGVVGLVLALGGLLALAGAAFARVRAADPGPDRLARAALAAAGAAWLVHSLYDWDWDIPGATLPALVALGVAAGRAPRPRAGGRPLPGARAVVLAVAVLAVLAGTVSAALPAMAQSRASSALDTAAGDDVAAERLAGAARDAELAARLDPVAVEPLFALATIAERIGSLGQARRQIVRAIERQPASIEAWSRLVRLEIALGDRVALARAAERLLALDPVSPATIALAGRAEIALTPPEGSATATGSPLPQPVPPAPPPAVP